MEQAKSEEVMRVKNQNAIQRALANDQNGRYKPSIQALKNNDQQQLQQKDYKSAGQAENQPPLSSHRSHQKQKSSIA